MKNKKIKQLRCFMLSAAMLAQAVSVPAEAAQPEEVAAWEEDGEVASDVAEHGLRRRPIEKMAVSILRRSLKQFCHQIRTRDPLCFLKACTPAVDRQRRPVRQCHRRTVLYLSIRFILIRHHCCMHICHTDIAPPQRIEMAVEIVQRIRHIRHIDIRL